MVCSTQFVHTGEIIYGLYVSFPLPRRKPPAVLSGSVLGCLPLGLCWALTLEPSSRLFWLDPWCVLWLLTEKGHTGGKMFLCSSTSEIILMLSRHLVEGLTGSRILHLKLSVEFWRLCSRSSRLQDAMPCVGAGLSAHGACRALLQHRDS